MSLPAKSGAYLIELFDYATHYPDRERALAEAYRRGGYSLQAIGVFFGGSRMMVSRAVKKIEAGCEEGCAMGDRTP